MADKHIVVEQNIHKITRIIAAQTNRTMGEVVADAIMRLPEVTRVNVWEPEEAPCASTPDR